MGSFILNVSVTSSALRDITVALFTTFKTQPLEQRKQSVAFALQAIMSKEQAEAATNEAAEFLNQV